MKAMEYYCSLKQTILEIVYTRNQISDLIGHSVGVWISEQEEHHNKVDEHYQKISRPLCSSLKDQKGNEGMKIGKYDVRWIDTALFKMNTHKVHIHGGGEVVRGFWVSLSIPTRAKKKKYKNKKIQCTYSREAVHDINDLTVNNYQFSYWKIYR